jgi:hypothetical protein
MTKKVLHFPERKDKLEDYNNQPCFSVLDEDDKFLMKVQKFRLKPRFADGNINKEVYGSIVVDDEELTVFVNDSSHPNKHYAVAKLSYMPLALGNRTQGAIRITVLTSPENDSSESSHKYKLIDLDTNTPTSYWDTEDV